MTSQCKRRFKHSSTLALIPALPPPLPPPPIPSSSASCSLVDELLGPGHLRPGGLGQVAVERLRIQVARLVAYLVLELQSYGAWTLGAGWPRASAMLRDIAQQQMLVCFLVDASFESVEALLHIAATTQFTSTVRQSCLATQRSNLSANAFDYTDLQQPAVPHVFYLTTNAP